MSVGRFRENSIVGGRRIISLFSWPLCFFLSFVGWLVLFVCVFFFLSFVSLIVLSVGSSMLVSCLFVMYPPVCGVCVFLLGDGEALDFSLVVVRF